MRISRDHRIGLARKSKGIDARFLGAAEYNAPDNALW